MTIAIVRAFIKAMQAKDKLTIATMLHDDIVQIVPFSPSGTSTPWTVFEGKEAVLSYIDSVFTSFTHIQFNDLVFTISSDGNTVFLEAQGDLVAAQNAMPYRNIHVLKFQFRRGLIKSITEYANPVTIAKLFSIPAG